MKRRRIALGICAVWMLSLVGCAKQTQPEDLLAGMQTEQNPAAIEVSERETSALALTECSVQLFQRCAKKGKPCLVSPLSALYALAMTANGAKGETLAQMEQLFGLSIEDLNEYLYAYQQALPSGDTYRLDSANALWVRDDGSIQMNESFLQTAATWYDASVFQAPFDRGTVKGINAWVRENTHGMIPEILDRFPPDGVLCLVNALAFEAEWDQIYYDFQVRDGTFTTEEGRRQSAEFMHADEHLYLEDDSATGFMKHYDDGAYAFVALLPNEGVTLQEFIDALTGERLRTLLSHPQETKVETALPKFQSENAMELAEILQTMGITDAFDPMKADFSATATTSTGLLYVGKVLQRTAITVDERGTKAGAATLVMENEGAAPPDQVKMVRLDRPFLYLIVDRQIGLPIFIGTVTEIRHR